MIQMQIELPVEFFEPVIIKVVDKSNHSRPGGCWKNTSLRRRRIARPEKESAVAVPFRLPFPKGAARCSGVAAGFSPR